MATTEATQNKFRNVLLSAGFTENEDGTFGVVTTPDDDTQSANSGTRNKRTLMFGNAHFDKANPKMLHTETFYRTGISDVRKVNFSSVHPIIVKLTLRKINK